MRVRIYASAAVLARTLAGDVARCLGRNPRLVLGLPTGRTPVRLYRTLTEMFQAGKIDFSRATTFNLDEFVGLDGDHPSSYRAFMNRHLFDLVNLRSARIHFLNGNAANLDQACREYERAIERTGGIDLQILGLGTNGHIGFNEPARALEARTHRTRLRPATRRANAALFGGRPGAVPREALSMGMATILKARRIILVATGAAKARCVARMIQGRVATRLPASFLQLHRNAEVWLDEAAASQLPRPRPDDRRRR